MKLPKDYRHQIYSYVEELIERPLTFDEHDDLRDMLNEYAFSKRNVVFYVRRAFCFHDWSSDNKVEAGQRTRVYVKCLKCDKRTKKRAPAMEI